MKVFHRMVGDPPSRGFNDSLMTPGFPINPAMAGIKSARIAIVGVPGARKESLEGTAVEQHRVYEVQSMPFGQVFAIHSAVGVKGTSRAHSYTNFVSLGGSPDAFTNSLGADQLLSFDGFLPLEWFWDLDKQSNTIEPGQWDGSARAQVFSKPLPEGFLDALLVYYWRAASRRMLDEKFDMVRVCLGTEEDCQVIIANARALIASHLSPRLPQVVQNIMSFSAPVPQQALQKYADSALVFLYPEKQLHCEFDLRDGTFPALSRLEQSALDLIAALAQQQPLPLIDQMEADYLRLFPQASAHTCPLLADFDLMLALYRLVSDPEPEKFPALWMSLSQRLTGLHQFSEAEADALLSGLDRFMLEKLGDSRQALPAFSEAEARFLLRKAQRLDGPLFAQASSLMARIEQDSVREKALFLPELLLKEADSLRQDKAAHAAGLLAETLQAVCLTDFPEPWQMEQLASPSFKDLCGMHPPLTAAMTDYTSRLAERHPGQLLLMLPLVVNFPETPDARSAALDHALELLRNRHTAQLPGEAVCDNIKRAGQHMNDEQKGALQAYGSELIQSHLQSPRSALGVCRGMGMEVAATLGQALSSMSGQGGRLDAPLSQQQLKDIADSLENGGEKGQVGKALEAYARLVLQRADEQGVNQFDWMQGAVLGSGLLSQELIRDMTLPHLLRFRGSSGTLLTKDELTAVDGWLSQRSQSQGTAVPTPMEKPVLDYYDALQGQAGVLTEAWDDQVTHLMDRFHSTEGQGAVNALHKKMVQKAFINSLESRVLQVAVAEREKDLEAAGIKVTDLLQDGLGDEVREKVKAALSHEMAKISTIEGFQEQLGKVEKNETPFGGLGDLWRQALQHRLKEAFPALFTGFGELEEAASLMQLLGKVNTNARPADWTPDTAAVSNLLMLDQAIRADLPKQDADSLKAWVDRNRFLLPFQGDGQVQSKIRFFLGSRYFPSKEDSGLTAHTLQQTVAAGLLCLPSAGEGAKKLANLMKPLVKTDVGAIKNPYAPEHMGVLASLCAVFQTLQELGETQYAKALGEALQADTAWKGFLERVWSDKGARASHFPWVETQFEPNDGRSGIPYGLLDCLDTNMQRR